MSPVKFIGHCSWEMKIWFKAASIAKLSISTLSLIWASTGPRREDSQVFLWSLVQSDRLNFLHPSTSPRFWLTMWKHKVYEAKRFCRSWSETFFLSPNMTQFKLVNVSVANVNSAAQWLNIVVVCMAAVALETRINVKKRFHGSQVCSVCWEPWWPSIRNTTEIKRNEFLSMQQQRYIYIYIFCFVFLLKIIFFLRGGLFNFCFCFFKAKL